MLAKRVVKSFGDRVRFEVEDFGDSELGERLGVAAYPAVFIDDVLVATPRDFFDWGTGQRGRYTPWKTLESRQAFEKDLTEMLELRLAGGRLERAAPPESSPRLPELDLTDLDGEALSTADLEGRVVVVAIWAPWCPPCRDSLDWLLTAAERHGEAELGVLVLAVQTDETAVREVLEPHRERLGSGSQPRFVVAGTDDADAFGGAMAVPTFRIFDRRGVLVSELYGAPPDLHERIDRRVAALLSSGRNGEGEAGEVRFSGADWKLNGEAKVAELGGREALLLRNGSAGLVDVVFDSGTIEFDVRTTGHRSFVGVGFRVQGAHREDFYLRPHNSGRFDAMQYTPVEHGISAWQLYPEHNATLDIPRDTWLHVELVVAGPRLEVFFDGSREPTLVVPELRRGKTRGRLSLWASFPAGEPRDLFPTAFASVVVQADSAHHEYPEPPTPAADSGLVREWAVSPSFLEPEDPESLPDLDRLGPFEPVAADAEGRVNLARVAALPEGARRGTVLARVVLSSDAPRVARLGFGFSDKATVFLNGRPVFRGDNSYRSRSERYLGVMRVDNDILYLPLETGENELTFAVTEAFGGWGVTARLLDQDGVEVRVPAE